MAEVCETCKVLAKSKYWQELPVTKHKFFKIMLGDFEHQLRVPRNFIEKFRGKISQCCTLRGQSGNEWKVQVTRAEDVLFTRGWDNFVRDHALKVYDFLLFVYGGDSSFEVSVFDASGCEREGSHFAKNMNLSSDKSCGSTLHTKENVGSSDSVMLEKEMNYSFEEIEVKDGRKRFPSLEKLGHEAVEEEDTDELSCDGREEGLRHFRLQRGRGDSSCGKQCQKYYISKRRIVTLQEKQRAYKRATDHESRSESTRRPMIEITMLPTHVYSGFHLTIPKQWAQRYMLLESHEVELQVPGAQRSWMVGCRWTPLSQCQIRAGWANFVLDNNLEEHDVCVFELVQRGVLRSKRISILNVHIFRVVAEVVPLVQSKRMV